MKSYHSFNEIFLCLAPVDFRMGIFALSALCQTKIQQNVFCNKRLFVFVNKKKTSLKLLYWDNTGFALWQKVLEKEKFLWPKKNAENDARIITERQLEWLLDGIDIQKINTHKILNFSAVS